MYSSSDLSSLMPNNSGFTDRLHYEALETAIRYKNAESNLIEILQQIEAHRVFLTKGHPSLFGYVVCELGLSESVAYNLISVSRKAREVPELAAEIRKGAHAFPTPTREGSRESKAGKRHARKSELRH